VHIVSDPPEANISVNGRAIQETTPADVEISLVNRSKLVLNKSGFRPWKRTIRPSPNVNLTIKAKIKK
jgi:hypothetical protein